MQEGWQDLDSFNFPQYDESYESEVKQLMNDNKDKYLLGALSVAVFSTIRDLRRIDNVLMDVILEKDNVVKLLGKLEDLAIKLVKKNSSIRI